MTCVWCPETISNETYRTKFNNLPGIIGDWLSDHGGLAGREILDFGCGEATTALAIALGNPSSRVVGIDIMPDFSLCAGLARDQLGLDALPDNLALHGVVPGALHDQTDRFDVIYSWSVVEHVEDRLLPNTLGLLRERLKPGGRLFIQIAPLFFSEDGSHLMAWVPEPWGHLLNQHDVYLDKLHLACASEANFETLRSMFETLNRLTGDELVGHAHDAGFSVTRQFRSDRNTLIPERLRQVYRPEILLNEQIVLLLEPV